MKTITLEVKYFIEVDEKNRTLDVVGTETGIYDKKGNGLNMLDFPPTERIEEQWKGKATSGTYTNRKYGIK